MTDDDLNKTMRTIKNNLMQYKNKCYNLRKEFDYNKELEMLRKKISEKDNKLYDKIYDCIRELLDRSEEFNQNNFKICFTKVPDEVGNKVKDRYPVLFNNQLSVKYNKTDLTVEYN